MPKMFHQCSVALVSKGFYRGVFIAQTLTLENVHQIREQLYYSNGYQEVSTSIHFVKIKTKYLQNPLDSNPGLQALLCSSAGCYTHMSTEAQMATDNAKLTEVQWSVARYQFLRHLVGSM